MQQLLSLNGQSELFTKLADEVSLSSGQSAAKEGSTEFSRALLAGLDAVQKEIAATTTKAKGEQSEQRMQRIAFDDEVVGVVGGRWARCGGCRAGRFSLRRMRT